MAATSGFGFSGFLIRWVAALILVFATFNPTPYSYYRWVADLSDTDLPLKAIAGIVLLIGYVIFLRATWRSIGPVGMILALALFAAVIWALIFYQIVDLYEPTALTWVALVVGATVLAIGLSWSHVRRRLSGQADIDDVDE